jgi:hypothetical protein
VTRAAGPDCGPTLGRVSCLTLIFWGTESGVLSEAQARRMVQALPRGGTRCGAGGRHAPTLVGVRPLEICKASGISSARAARQSVVSGIAWLDTFSFQARGFYEKLGYEEFGQLDYPPDHHRHFMRKRLTQRE